MSKSIIRDKQGIALIVTLFLAAIAIMLIGVLMNLVLTGTKMSADIKQYTTALEAAKGGVNEFILDMGNYIYYKGLPSDNGSQCKIQQDTSNWSVSCRGYMNITGYTVDDLSSHSSVDDIIKYPDWKGDFGNYEVYAKIVDTRGSADGKWYYTLDVVSQNKISPQQKAWITVFLRTD